MSQLKQNGLWKYLFNTSWMFVEKVVRLGFAFLVGIYVARYLGPYGFGQLNFAMSFVGIFSVLATLGLSGVVIRELVNNPGYKDVLLGTSFFLSLGGVLCAWALIIMFSSFLDDDISLLLIAVISLSITFQGFYVIEYYFQARVEARYVVFAKLVQVTLSSILKLLLIYVGADVVAFAWALLFDGVVLSIGYLFVYYKTGNSIERWRFRLNTAKNLLTDSWPLLLSGFFVSIYMKVDQIMINNILTTEDVGIYASATKIIEAWMMLPVMISLSVFPAIINAKKVDRELYNKRLQSLYFLMARMSVVGAIFATLFSEEIILLLFGKEYIEASNVLFISMWSMVFAFLSIVASRWFVTENLQKILLYKSFVGMFLNVSMNLFFIEKYGLVGAAYATLISQIISTYLIDVFNPKTRQMFRMKTRAMLLVG